MRRPPSSSFDPAEVSRFDALAGDWWDPRGPMRALHRLNPVRLAYIRDAACRHFGRDPRSPAPLGGLTVLDIGCGGGLASEPLARLGAAVTGIDPAAANIEAASRRAARLGLTVAYRCETLEEVVGRGDRFDLVLALEVVEHVADAAAFVQAGCAAVAPDGLLIVATINRTLRAFALAIVGAEYLLGWLPRGTHQWNKFVTPDELAAAIESGGLAVFDAAGLVYDPLADAWALSRDTAVNYLVTATRRPTSHADRSGWRGPTPGLAI